MSTLPAKSAYHHGNLKPALISAALKEIAKEGPDGFSLRGVARRAGVSAPAVYNHFESKEDLLSAVAAECSERVGAAIAEAHASAPDHPLEQFRATGMALIRFAAAHPEHYRAMCLPGMAKYKSRTHEDRESDADRILAAQRAGLITDLPVDHVMLAGSALVNGLAQMIVEGQLGPVDDERARELAIAITGVLGVGLIPRTEDVEDPYNKATIPGRKKR
jgi:AcrR family transcriptional regulator